MPGITIDILSHIAPASAGDYDHVGAEHLRRFAAAWIVEKVQACLELPMGLPLLAAWFEGEGRQLLDMAGMGHLADMPSGDLAKRAFKWAGEALDDPSRRCANCKHLLGVNGNGRVRCGQDQWREAGYSGDYARATVENSSRPPFGACEYFERKE